MKNPYHHPLNIHLSEALWQAIHEKAQTTGDSVNHIINMALAKALDLEHSTLFQVSTSTALVQGVYSGCMKIKDIKQHGNLGLGTFDHLDGEGIMLDGQVWQAKSDGSVSLVSDDVLVPFWVVTDFKPQLSFELNTVTSWQDLQQQLNTQRHSNNTFTAIRIHGVFDYIQYRVACSAEDGTDLVTATSQQAVFEVRHCHATLLGFWTPSYAKNFNVPGYHLHLLSDDHQYAGHILAVSGSHLKVELAEDGLFKLALPETKAFLEANLNIDPTAALSKAEGSREK